ncbi:ABC transporter permease [Arthrobacter sp. NPDC080031]|uniref:ABC transporter permease n=1 Tax=Arthrobacter sp. NPDC080031 TaxID=3155918 RepID=UPI00344BFED7
MTITKPTIPNAPHKKEAAKKPLPFTMRRRRPHKVELYVAFFWFGLIVFAAVAADWLPLRNFEASEGPARLAPFANPNWILGTDQLGRDVLARLVYGARVSLIVSVSAVVVGMIVGGLLGATAGYLRGKVEVIFNIIIDSALAFPPLILLLAVTAVLTPSLPSLTAALTLLTIPAFARLARAGTLPLRNREFVQAAKSMGARDGRIIVKEILPSVTPSLMAYGFVVAATVIVAEGSLSFLGLGIPPPAPSWGGMIANSRSLLAQAPWLIFLPAVALVLTVHSLNVIGNWARELAEAPTKSKGA